MALVFYNTLTRKKEVFKPFRKKEVQIYACGPTVYSYAHIGNFRAYVFSDILRRYLGCKEFKVKLIMNITDVDDKTIRNSRKEKIPLKEFTEKYKKAFFEDMKTLNIKPADVYPEATKHIKEMVKLVKILLKKGFAYKAKDGIYYSISKFREYGKLALLDMKGLKPGARISADEYDKENVNDFVLWKFWDRKDGEVFWETEIGKGRPGWHIECSAMSMKYLRETFDIHSGGVDLIFPHHQNEIAQSEAATSKKLAHYWLHNEHLFVNGKKMSKSLGNFFTLRDLLKKYSPRAIRYLLISGHYRTRLNLTHEALKQAEETIKRLDDFVSDLDSVKGEKENKDIPLLIDQLKKSFSKALDDDLNMPLALSELFEFVREINIIIGKNTIGKKNADALLATLEDIDRVLGLDLKPKKVKLTKEIRELIALREKYRKAGEWKKADRIRSDLRKRGFILEDSEEGVRIKFINK